MPREDEPFQIIKKINDSAYKMEFPNEYSVSATFNVSDLSLFNVGDNLRANPFEERGNDMIASFNIKRSIRGFIGFTHKI
jgi:purine-nucleoside phosphorylase